MWPIALPYRKVHQCNNHEHATSQGATELLTLGCHLATCNVHHVLVVAISHDAKRVSVSKMKSTHSGQKWFHLFK
jgi:hypothetical protein